MVYMGVSQEHRFDLKFLEVYRSQEVVNISSWIDYTGRVTSEEETGVLLERSY